MGSRARQRSTGLSEERLAVLWQLAAAGARRGFRLVVLVPPRYGPWRDPDFDAYLGELRRLEREIGVAVLDFSTVPALEREHFYDTGHLDVDGAAIFSRELAGALAPLLAARPPGG